MEAITVYDSYLKAKLNLLNIEEKLIDLKDQEEIYKKENRIEFYTPWPHQKQAFDLLHSGKKTIIFQGSNQIGKTALGVNICGAAALGYQPWDNKSVTHLFGKPPTKIRILCADWEHHAKEVIVPKLIEWLPKKRYETKKNNVGVEAYFTFNNGSTIELLTHVQETKSQEGWTGNVVWADEPLPRSKYSANKRGLVFYSGIFLLTMTAVYEPWVKKELVNNPTPGTGLVLSIPMRANPLLKEEDIKEFELACPKEEVNARVYGGWLQLSGQVIPEFNPTIQIVDSFKVPPNWPVLGLYDFHPGKPQAIGFYAFDIYNRIFVIYETWENLSPEEIADEVLRLKQKNSWRLENFLIDPLAKGDTQYIKRRGVEIKDTFNTIKDKLEPFGINVDVASKDVESGIANIRASCKSKPEAFFICRNCELHIEQIENWVKDPETGKPKKGKDIEDHFMENLYRATLAGIIYEDMKQELFKGEIKHKRKGIV